MLRKGERVVVINDVATGGTTILDAVKVIDDAGGCVRVAIALFDREKGAEDKLKKVGVPLIAFVKNSELPRPKKETEAA